VRVLKQEKETSSRVRAVAISMKDLSRKGSVKERRSWYWGEKYKKCAQAQGGDCTPVIHEDWWTPTEQEVYGRTISIPVGGLNATDNK